MTQPGASTPQLRRAAAQGDLAAITLLLNRSLEPQHTQVTARIQGHCLHLRLDATKLPTAAICVTLLARELKAWSLQPAFTAMIDGYENLAKEPQWSEQLDLTSRSKLESIAQGFHRPHASALPQESPLPAARSPQYLDIASIEQRREEFGIPVQAIDRLGWQTMGAGLFLALLLLASEQVTFLFSPLITLIHELGHAATAWFFGYPAIPAFDFMYGGGVTVHGDRVPLILWLVYGGIAFLFYVYRRNRLTLTVLLITTIFYTWWAIGSTHEMLFVAMGHGFEIIFSGIFLYRGLSGYGCRYPIERPLYGMIGFFTVLYNLRFAWRLQFDQVQRQMYLYGKGSIDHDFVRLARDFFQTDLSTVAAVFWWLMILTPVFIFILYRYRQLMLFVFARLFLTRSD
ncbi:hypothetical protein L3556_10725 [Candidatus Synechococcus calcipolaris G9]|uniref:Peptidase M50 n=1 Tax=Candidatus Synechococcus calcipolaris G9 TaxID=1497997 RepID=A0ABT6F0L2_9SYNE|nr:hypothetical protein [Candidatus Synechococcus calcipolaris]MDG2991399.1 hypothetical protein [Candidatus Synechococcus calcipolaris G9]